MGIVSKSTFSTKNIMFSLADVQHIEKHYFDYNSDDGEVKKGDFNFNMVITKHTKWNFEHDTWENAIYLPIKDALEFDKAWRYYQYELNKDRRK